MTTRLSKALLTSHVATSVGWLGAVAGFISIAIACLSAVTIESGRAMYPALQVITWYIIVPLCIASLASGILQAIFTPWGLFKHYWIVVKLILTVVMTALLLLHLGPISFLAGITGGGGAPGALSESRTLIDLIAKSGAAIVGLLAVTTISIYKPWGRIKRDLSMTRRQVLLGEKKPLGYYLIIFLALILLTIIIVHLGGSGMGKHG